MTRQQTNQSINHLHGTGLFCRSKEFLSLPRNCPHFLEPGSLPHSQEPSRCPYPEPEQSNPRPSNLLLEDPLNVILQSTSRSFKWSPYLRFFRQNPVYTSSLLHTGRLPPPHLILVLMTRILFGEDYKCSLVKFTHEGPDGSRGIAALFL